MIDFMLENAIAPSNKGVNFSDLVGCSDCVAFPEANLVQVGFQRFCVTSEVQSFTLGIPGCLR